MITKEEDNNISKEKKDYKRHWNASYLNNTTEKLGWFEEKSEKTLELIKATKLNKNATILNVGSGSSTLIDDLLKEGFSNIIANDLAEESLEFLKKRIGNDSNVQFLVDDLLHPLKLNKLENIDLWNDRAVLHFFQNRKEIDTYFNLLKEVISPNGFVIISVFSKNGAEKCCGLPLKRYDLEMLQKELGSNFKLLKTFNYTFVNPFGGERPYIYTLFQRKN